MPYKINRLFVNDMGDIPEHAPVILDDMSLAFQIGVDNRVLWYMGVKSKLPPLDARNPTDTKDRNPFYTRIEIPKGKDAVRVVHDVSKTLPMRAPAHTVLKSLSALLFSKMPWPEYVDAYVPGKSIVDSANKHAGHHTAICFDIKNFFPSVTRGMLRRAIHNKLGYNRYLSGLIASLVTLEKRLPQGSPIAPEMANLAAWHAFDEKIVAGLIGSDWVYSRYSDDIIVSHPDTVSDADCDAIETLVYCHVQNNGFRINHDKVRRYGRGEGRLKSMKWLGLTINQKVNADQKTYRKLRQLLYHASNTGFAEQAEYHGENPAKFKAKLRGLMSHLKGVLNEDRMEKLEEAFALAEAREVLDASE